MNKKNIFILFFIIFITGCSTNYNIQFNDQEIKEKISIGKIENKSEEEIYLYEPIAFDEEYYNFEYKNNYVNLDYTYTIDEYRTSYLINECYDLVGITYDDDYYYFKTSNQFKCINYNNYTNENVTINFTTNHKVIETNADDIKNNVYTWNINKTNYNNKPIDIKVKKEVPKKTSSNNNKNNTLANNTPISIVLLILAIIVGIVVFIIRIISKRRNEL